MRGKLRQFGQLCTFYLFYLSNAATILKSELAPVIVVIAVIGWRGRDFFTDGERGEVSIDSRAAIIDRHAILVKLDEQWLPRAL